MGVLTCVCIIKPGPQLCSDSVPSIVALTLMNGGTTGGIWVFIVVCVEMFFVVLSMAEMAEMASMYVMLAIHHASLPIRCRAPTSEGQYHWISEFAPPQYQKFLSYIVGHHLPRSPIF